jgi:hypothetical protein
MFGPSRSYVFAQSQVSKLRMGGLIKYFSNVHVSELFLILMTVDTDDFCMMGVHLVSCWAFLNTSGVESALQPQLEARRRPWRNSSSTNRPEAVG